MLVRIPRPRGAAGWAVLAFAWIFLFLARPGTALPLAMTKESVQKKAVIIKNDAKLYARASGEEGKPVKLMEIFFLLVGESSGRAPVTYGPNKTDPDGWLDRSSFTEWNTLQMINFEPQSGRELARIFKDSGCAESFSKTAVAGASCPELGSEPQRTGPQKDNYGLLIPVMQREGENYQGGFVRVTQGAVVKVKTDDEAGTGATAAVSRLGYDLVLVIDSTASMEEWFRPTTEALDGFISSVKQQIGSGERQTPFRVGLLLYRDRKVIPDCDIGFLFRWEAELTDNISAVSQALAKAKDASPCGSDEAAESVYDALNRAALDPKWNDGYFKVILLVGDAPPHGPENKDKNPLGLDVDDITKETQQRNIRIMAFKIGPADENEFEALALSVKEDVRGRFRAIEPSSSAYKSALSAALREEWDLLTAGNQAVKANITKKQAQADPKIFEKKGIDVSKYDIPIIIANLPPGSAGSGAPEFVQGWVPKNIKEKLAVGEYIFMAKGGLQRFVNVIDTISLAAQEGITEGGDAFIKSLRSSLATMLNVPPEELFRSGESLDSTMKKAEVLPFKTTVFSFTSEEVNAWKPAEFQKLNKILSEKITALREYSQKPANTRMFGDKPHVYVPRDLFP